MPPILLVLAIYVVLVLLQYAILRAHRAGQVSRNVTAVVLGATIGAAVVGTYASGIAGTDPTGGIAILVLATMAFAGGTWGAALALSRRSRG
jgi:hypothetical protein